MLFDVTVRLCLRVEAANRTAAEREAERTVAARAPGAERWDLEGADAREYEDENPADVIADMEDGT